METDALVDTGSPVTTFSLKFAMVLLAQEQKKFYVNSRIESSCVGGGRQEFNVRIAHHTDTNTDTNADVLLEL